jgi:hypothetical protein
VQHVTNYLRRVLHPAKVFISSFIVDGAATDPAQRVEDVLHHTAPPTGAACSLTLHAGHLLNLRESNVFVQRSIEAAQP